MLLMTQPFIIGIDPYSMLFLASTGAATLIALGSLVLSSVFVKLKKIVYG